MPRWTPESRAAQAQRIRATKPWSRSTGPRTPEGKLIASLNSRKHGLYSAGFLDLQRSFRRVRLFLALADTDLFSRNSDIKETLTSISLYNNIQIHKNRAAHLGTKPINRGYTMAEAEHATQLASAFNIVRLYPQGWQSASFRNDEGRDVYYARAKPVGPKVGTVVFTPGYGDSVNFHYDAIRNWQERGYEVWAMDWIGQGLSDRENPANVKDSNDRLLTRHMNDLHKFATEIVQRSPDQPLLLASHSMGGNVGMLYLKHFPQTFDGAVLGAPMLDLNTSFLPRPVFKSIVTAATALGFGDKPLPNWRPLLDRITDASQNLRNLSKTPDQLTLSQEAQEKMRSFLKPVEIDLPTWNFIRRSYHAMDEMREANYYDDIKTPVLLVAAGRDELVSNKTIRFAAAHLPHGRLLELPLSEHGVWNSNATSDTALWKGIDGFIDHDIRHGAPLAPQTPAIEVPQRREPVYSYVPSYAPGPRMAFG